MIGDHGGLVVRTIRLSGKDLKAGTFLSPAQISTIPEENRKALESTMSVKWFESPREIKRGSTTSHRA